MVSGGLKVGRKKRDTVKERTGDKVDLLSVHHGFLSCCPDPVFSTIFR